MDISFSKKHTYRFDEATHVTLNSELYRALDLDFNRTVALKRVKIVGDSPKEKRDNLDRATLEVRTMTQIAELTAKVPNIYEMWFDDKEGYLYIIMQWISGVTLSEKMEMTIAPSVFVEWMEYLCLILDAMSIKRFQHKDIKPDNIMFNDNGDLYLIDFNLSVSAPNQMEGTYMYKAPEMDFGSTTMDRTKVDMFSIGVMLYQFFTGKIPQRMIDYDIYDLEKEKWDMFLEPKDVNGSISSKLNKMIIKLMSYSPKDRYWSYKALRNDLRDIKRELKSKKNSRVRM